MRVYSLRGLDSIRDLEAERSQSGTVSGPSLLRLVHWIAQAAVHPQSYPLWNP